MVLEDSDVRDGDQPAELVIRALLPEEARLHANLAAAGFEAPEEYFRSLMTPAVLSAMGACCYVGEVDGERVTTSFAVTLGDFVGIFNVATPPAHRRRGYGAAVSARAVRDGLNNGARWAWLQSSSAGYPVYERLGFRTAESWHCCVMP
jgi:predicted GNAT family acetyltransferase